VIDFMEEHESALPDEAFSNFLDVFSLRDRFFCERHDLRYARVAHQATEPVQHLVEGDRSVDLDPYALERLAFDTRISGHLLCLSSGEFNKRFLCGAAAELRPGHAKDLALKMPSSVKADLLDDGIVDTLVSVGATRLDNAAADSTDPHKRIHSHQLEYTVRPVKNAKRTRDARSRQICVEQRAACRFA
jgi:hypothetical protein